MTEPAPAPGITVEELFSLPDDGYKWELVAGEIVREPPPGEEPGGVTVTLVARLHAFVREHRLGRVFGETGYVLASGPDTVRGPDASFVSAERLASLPRRGPYVVGAPDLAVEVLSPGNTRWEIEAEVGEYLGTGSRAVWVVDPRRQTVVVHRPGRAPETLEEGAVLDGGDSLPGFHLPVAEIFEE